jgi:hypothetical protein
MRAKWLPLCAAMICSSTVMAQTGTAGPPCSAPEYRQLDFWVGNWALEYTKGDGTIGRATNRITVEYGGCAIVERFVLPDGLPDGGDFVGGSVSIHDAHTKSWRQMWVDNTGGMYDLRGGPVTGQRHVFELVNIESRPQADSLRMIWEDVTPGSLTWRWQARAADGTWADRGVLRYRRQMRP